MRNSSYSTTYKNFLSTPKTISCLDRNFVEWHNGISHYGFWAVVINDPDWIVLWSVAHAHMKRFIHPGYQRAPHITIIACGLLDQNYFSTKQFNQQAKILSETTILPFYLKVGSLNSFSTAPYLEIEDSAEALKHIRDRLRVISEEDTLVQYEPHITLGLYRDTFSTIEVADCLSRFKCAPTRQMLVTELFFCVYETKQIQGRFRTMKRIMLNVRPAVRGCL